MYSYIMLYIYICLRRQWLLAIQCDDRTICPPPPNSRICTFATFTANSLPSGSHHSTKLGLPRDGLLPNGGDWVCWRESQLGQVVGVQNSSRARKARSFLEECRQVVVSPCGLGFPSTNVHKSFLIIFLSYGSVRL